MPVSSDEEDHKDHKDDPDYVQPGGRRRGEPRSKRARIVPPKQSIGSGASGTTSNAPGKQPMTCGAAAEGRRAGVAQGNPVYVEFSQEVSQLRSFGKFASSIEKMMQEVVEDYTRCSQLSERVEALETENGNLSVELGKVREANSALNHEAAQVPALNEKIEGLQQKWKDIDNNWKQRFEAEQKRHLAEVRERAMMISALVSDEMAPWERNEVCDQAETLAFEFQCCICQEVVWKKQDILISSCGDPDHGVCSDCLPDYMRSEITKLMREDRAWEAPSCKISCPYNCYHEGECTGTLGRDQLRNAFRGQLRKSRPNPATLYDMDYFDAWQRNAVERSYHMELRARQAKDKDAADETSNWQEAMRAEGWNRFDKSENKVFECPRCHYGPVILNACADLSAHNGQTFFGDSAASSNHCPRCEFFAEYASGWLRWKGEVDQHTPAPESSVHA